MVKKFEQLVLLTITVIFIGFMAGVFIGRLANHTTVNLSSYDHSKPETSDSTETKNTATGRININFATTNQLAMLPGIGEIYAQRIVAYRQENGPFLCIDDLKKVDGIGNKRFEAIYEYITVGD